ncbi:MAG: hypothetical protein MI749_01600 [Desulfovibrionales bacterium]|nr:hypothetical protein [Desulfovibrionales bacterium]
MLRLQILIMSAIACILLGGCGTSEPDQAFCKHVYSILKPTAKDNVDKWSELVLDDGVLVRADTALFWVDSRRRIFALNSKGRAITDAQSGISTASSVLVKNINSNLRAAGKNSLNSQGGWKFFKWNK